MMFSYSTIRASGPSLCLVYEAKGVILNIYMYANYTNIQSIFCSELERHIWEGCWKLANRQTWPVTRLLTALQVKALFTQGCSRTHCTPQALLNAEGEPYCWMLAGWKCRALWEPWSCMSVPWSLPHLLSPLLPTRGTPGSPGLALRSPLRHQSNCQYYNRFLPHKEVHHQSPGCCCCSFCRKITRETGRHQRRVCSLGEEQVTGKCVSCVQSWLC